MKNWTAFGAGAALAILVLITAAATLAAVGTGTTEILRFAKDGVTVQVMDNTDGTRSVCLSATDAKLSVYAQLHTELNAGRYAELLREYVPGCEDVTAYNLSNCDTLTNRQRYMAYHYWSIGTTEYHDLTAWNSTRNAVAGELG